MNTTHNTTSKLLTCEFCYAFNGKGRCGCGEARKARGEKPTAPVGVLVEW